MTIYGSIEEDMNFVFPYFDLVRLQCMKTYLEMRHREKEAKERSKSESESYEVSRPSPMKGALDQSDE